MVNPLLTVFGAVDLVAGAILALSSNLLLGDVARYLGFVLIGKGLWTIFTSVKF